MINRYKGYQVVPSHKNAKHIEEENFCANLLLENCWKFSLLTIIFLMVFLYKDLLNLRDKLMLYEFKQNSSLIEGEDDDWSTTTETPLSSEMFSETNALNSLWKDNAESSPTTSFDETMPPLESSTIESASSSIESQTQTQIRIELTSTELSSSPSFTDLSSTPTASMTTMTTFIISNATTTIVAPSTTTIKYGNPTTNANFAPSINTANASITWKDYYVYTKQCKMPRVNPFTAQAKKIFKGPKRVKCSDGESPVRKTFDEKLQRYKLHKTNESLDCCYSEVMRTGSGRNADKKVKLLPCTKFHQDFVVPERIDGMIIECKINDTKKVQTSQEAFTFIQKRNKLRYSNESNHNNVTSKRKKPSLLLIGIDSLSRMNFRRTMPETFEFLRKQENWIEMEGYNKVGDNTFPNLMPLLTGKNESLSFKACNPRTVNGLDNCNFIWKDFGRNGYITAYAEDAAGISTFNYVKVGFNKPPADHYYRPFGLAIEKSLKKKNKKCGLIYCLGRRASGEYVYDFAFEFTERYRKQPAFGLFWTNSFSHNCFDISSAMDSRMRKYLEAFGESGIMDEAIVVFFSDHGRRWGPLLSLAEGYLEERLPMFFISLPKWFREEYPQFAEALNTNRHRLTTPFDAFSTWQHLLKLNGVPEKNLPPAESCKNGQSLFLDIPENRTCDDACIPAHWCTCQSYIIAKKDDSRSKKVVNLIINEINGYLQKQLNLTDKCSKLSLNKILSIMMKQSENGLEMKNTPTYRIKFRTQPSKAEFEATACYDVIHNSIKVDVPDISRLNKYESDSKCISHKIAKKFCICPKK